MASRCTGTNRGILKVNLENGELYVEVKARTAYEYAPQIEGAVSYRLNQRVELPKGMTFENGKLSGQFENEGVYHIDFIGEDADGKSVGAFKLIVTATTNGPKVGSGCFGSIAGVSALFSLVAVAGVGLLAVTARKRRRA